jgi:putative transposase
LKTMRLDYPIALLCRVFDVSRSGFYAWLARKPSPRQQADERLKVAIKAAHRQSRETYGVRRM